jgi:hypothetical protein
MALPVIFTPQLSFTTMENIMTPDDSFESMAARSRLLNKGAKPIEITMKVGDDEVQTATINVPNEALNADLFHRSVEDFVNDALAVRMIQV